jgi:hypothetical protein
MRCANASKPNRKSGVRWGERGVTRPVSGRSVESENETADRFAPNEQTKRVVPHLRRSTACLWTQPFQAGLIFGAGPLGLDCKHRFPMFIPPLTCRGQVGCS